MRDLGISIQPRTAKPQQTQFANQGSTYEGEPKLVLLMLAAGAETCGHSARARGPHSKYSHDVARCATCSLTAIEAGFKLAQNGSRWLKMFKMAQNGSSIRSWPLELSYASSS